ncbi:sensor histidine kinase [Companilactobacillus halodurans]|uniref:histidine kinase n=1 Tax=Companilactobacillus halodurans TaxID=2584183 RepID=A0A5P0ZP05_9LACO|nr:HAMP domain-containing sensor histidine kinase [Companilactobacillus halodurans]MQS75973.1 HAMP domain-containing histidine kinase [Companilactobacillus halodurans]MQS96408.1 HAMP domain-containing histidine kinase [Companilactobacillus halodurans]
MNKKVAPTYQELINNAIRKLVIIITVSISILILVVVGIQRYSQTVRDAQGQMMSLYRANIDDIPSFIHWNNQNNRHTRQNTVIRVKTKQSSITASSSRMGPDIITTSASKKFINQHKFKILPGQHIVYVQGYGLFLFYKNSEDGTTYQLWASLNNLISSMILLLIIISIITFITLGFGTWWAAQLSAKLSSPTIALVNETRKKIKDTDADQPTLQVPKSPQEISELGHVFNELLKTQNKRLQRERDFVSNASHELKTPIAAIRGNINLIKRHGDKHPDVIPESLGFIDEESLRMQNLIKNLLDLSRADRAELILKDVDFSKLAQNIGTQYQKTIAQHLKLEIEPNLHISGNDDTLKQIIVALLDNANKYSSEDKPITLSLKEVDGKARLDIADLGIGIPDDQKSLIFQRFYRVDVSHSTEIKGSGLGLSIVSQLVKLNNGTIEVLDNQPCGSIFRVWF